MGLNVWSIFTLDVGAPALPLSPLSPPCPSEARDGANVGALVLMPVEPSVSRLVGALVFCPAPLEPSVSRLVGALVLCPAPLEPSESRLVGAHVLFTEVLESSRLVGALVLIPPVSEFESLVGAYVRVVAPSCLLPYEGEGVGELWEFLALGATIEDASNR